MLKHQLFLCEQGYREWTQSSDSSWDHPGTRERPRSPKPMGVDVPSLALSGAARAVLERAYAKDGHAVTLMNPGLPGIVLNYTAWEEITDDIDDARIYGGIHFRFDQEAGSHQGRHIGQYIVRTYLRSPDELDDFEDDE